MPELTELADALPDAKRRTQPVVTEKKRAIPSLVCVSPVLVRDFVLAVGVKHVVSYKETGNKTTSMKAWKYDIDDDGMSIAHELVLKESPHFDDGPIPIVEVSDTHVFRADFNGTVYIWSLADGERVFHAACAKPIGDLMAVYAPCAATHTSLAIIVISSPTADTTTVGVCINWTGGNEKFSFFDSAVPLVTSITSTWPTQFYLASAVGVCALSIAIPDPKTWAIIPYTRVNTCFCEVDNDVELMRELVPLSKFEAQMKKWIDAFMQNKAIEDSAIIEEIRTMKFRRLSPDLVPRHVSVSNYIITIVCRRCIMRVNETTREINVYKNPAIAKSIACLGVDGITITVTVDGDIFVIGDDGHILVPATAFTSKGKGMYQIEVRPSAPNNTILQRFGKYIFVNLYQKHVFPFYLQEKKGQESEDGML